MLSVINGSLSISQAKSQSIRKSNRHINKTRKKSEQANYDNMS